MLQLSLCEALVVIHGPIANQLNLGDTGDGLEVGMEDGLLLALGLLITMTVTLRSRVEGL